MSYLLFQIEDIQITSTNYFSSNADDERSSSRISSKLELINQRREQLSFVETSH